MRINDQDSVSERFVEHAVRAGARIENTREAVNRTMTIFVANIAIKVYSISHIHSSIDLATYTTLEELPVLLLFFSHCFGECAI